MAVKIQLKQIMADRGLTYRQVSQGANVSTSILSKINHEQQKMIALDVIDRLTDYLECEPGELIVKVKEN
jgi:DNA-binding Xre family transcriptional regulator